MPPPRFPLFRTVASIFCLAVAGLAGCSNDDAASSKPLSNVVYVGDSLTAGYQNGSLLDTQQPHGYAAVLAAQAGFSIKLPLIAPPGLPPVLKLVSAGFPPVVVSSTGTTTGRDNPTVQPTDLAVPGHLLHDVLATQPVAVPSTGQQIMTSMVLGYPQGNTKSQLDQAIALKPSMVVVWAGNNDALAADSAGTPLAMTSLSSFTADFTQLMTTLKSQTSARMVVANIPDVTQVPYMTPASTILSEASRLTGLPTATLSVLLGIQPGDLVNADGLALLENALATNTVTPLPGSAVLTAAEIATVQANINAYNQVIQQQATAVGAVVVDMHAYFATLAAGVTVNGKRVTNSFLGGLFGLDGVHPTNTGYALVANQFIAAMNNGLRLTIAPVNVDQIAATDPYVGVNSAAVGHIPAVAARRTDSLLSH